MTQAIMTAAATYAADALAELQQIEPTVAVEHTIAPGVALLTWRGDFADLGARLATAPPCFVRHICPVDAVAALTGTEDDVAALRQAVDRDLVDALPTSTPFSVQTRVLADELPYRPFDINNRLARAIRAATGATLDVRAPGTVVSVVIGRWRSQLVGWLGASDVRHNLSDWAGGERRFRREPEQISRSEFVLLEALDVFGITIAPQARALDLGAAPGGWTRILRQHEATVVAVDPAPLDERIARDWSVWQARESADSYLKRHPNPTPKDQFDVIVNDMHVDARYAAHTMVNYARLLRPGGQALMTLKLPQRDYAAALSAAVSTLEQAYVVAGMRHLFHNRGEVTLWLRPRA